MDRKKMKGHCSTGQSPQRAVVPMEEEEEVACFYYCINDSRSHKHPKSNTCTRLDSLRDPGD